MTRLTETLPILHEAVPALPDKVQAVAGKSDEFHREAQEALNLFREKRAEAEALVEQVREALEAVRDHAAQEEQRLENLNRDLAQAVDEEARGIEAAAGELHGAGEQAVDAFEALESSLVQAGDRTETAHDEARGAVDALTAEARSSEPELEAATDAVVAALGSTQQAIAEGQSLVTQAMTSLTDTMLRLLNDAQERLGQTYQRLDDVRAGQEQAVGEAISALDGQLDRLQQHLGERVEPEVQQALDPELQAVEAALTEMAQQTGTLQADVASPREELAAQLTALAERIPPLQGGAESVKGAAAHLGISWP